MARADKQINVRQSQDRYEVLEAAAYLEHKTPGRFVEDLVAEAIDRYFLMPSVQKALEARAERSAEEGRKVASLPQGMDSETGSGRSRLT